MYNAQSNLRQSWADYRRYVFLGIGVDRGQPFNQKHLAYRLHMAWAVAKAADAAGQSSRPLCLHLLPSQPSSAGPLRYIPNWSGCSTAIAST